MDPITLGITAGAASGLLNIGGNFLGTEQAYSKSKHLAERNYYYSSALQRQAAETNEKMYKNRYQWAMEDLEKAGLNPTLMMGDGGGAPTPSVGTNSASGGSIPESSANPFNNLVSALTASKELSLMDAERGKIQSETDVNNNISGKTQQETLYLMENTKKVRADIENTLANTRLSEAQRQETMEKIDVLLKEEQKIGEEIKNLEKQGEILDVQKAFARAEAIQRQITGYVDSAVGVANAVKGTSALPLNMKSVGTSAIYHQPGYLWNQ